MAKVFVVAFTFIATYVGHLALAETDKKCAKAAGVLGRD